MFSSLFLSLLGFVQLQAQWFSGPSLESPNATIINSGKKM